MIEPVQSNAGIVLDIARHRGSADLSLWWIGQSGFVCAAGDRVLVFDPYLSDSLTAKYAGTPKPHVRISRQVMTPWELRYAGPTVVTATHQHTDHLDADTLRPVLCDEARTRLVAPAACRAVASERSGLAVDQITFLDSGEAVDVDGIALRGVPAAHPQLARDGWGHHLCIGLVARLGGWTVYHSGDTVVYDGMADGVRSDDIDVAILPINGKVGNMNGADAARLAKDVSAKLVIPCHYDMFEFNTADPYEQFVPECERLGQPYRVLQLGERLTIHPQERP